MPPAAQLIDATKKHAYPALAIPPVEHRERVLSNLAAYGLDKLGDDQTALVFDLGGGTFDVTIMRIEGSHIRMIASNGDHRLGGKDWDDVILRWVAEEFERIHGDNPLLDLQSY